MVKDYNSIDEFQKPGQNDQANGFFAIEDSQKNRYHAAETQGGRDSQEDAMFLANIEIPNPQEYFQNHFTQMVQQNKDKEAGTTAALYYFDPEKRTITTANLGDSRVYLTIKNGNEYKTILLTQDHNPNLPRVKKEVEGKGGSVIFFRVNGSLAVGGAIGDNGIPILTNPDIWTFNIDELAAKAFPGAQTQDLEFNIINACDGLTNHIRDSNYDFGAFGTSESGASERYELRESSNIHQNSLSLLVSNCPEGTDLAQYLMNDANENIRKDIEGFTFGYKSDNISVNAFTFKGNEIGGLQPTLGGVFDGHGGNEVSQSCVQYMRENHREVVFEYELDGFVVGGGAAAPDRSRMDSMPAAGAAPDENLDIAQMMAKIAREERHGAAAPSGVKASAAQCTKKYAEKINEYGVALELGIDRIIDQITRHPFVTDAQEYNTNDRLLHLISLLATHKEATPENQEFCKKKLTEIIADGKIAENKNLFRSSEIEHVLTTPISQIVRSSLPFDLKSQYIDLFCEAGCDIDKTNVFTKERGTSNPGATTYYNAGCYTTPFYHATRQLLERDVTDVKREEWFKVCEKLKEKGANPHKVTELGSSACDSYRAKMSRLADLDQSFLDKIDALYVKEMLDIKKITEYRLPTTKDEQAQKQLNIVNKFIDKSPFVDISEFESVDGNDLQINSDATSAKEGKIKFYKKGDQVYVAKPIGVESEFGTTLFRYLSKGAYASKHEYLIRGEDGKVWSMSKYDKDINKISNLLKDDLRSELNFDVSSPGTEQFMQAYARMMGVLHVFGEADSNPQNFFVNENGKPVKIDNSFFVNLLPEPFLKARDTHKEYQRIVGCAQANYFFRHYIFGDSEVASDGFSKDLERFNRSFTYDEKPDNKSQLQYWREEFAKKMSELYVSGINDDFVGKNKNALTDPRRKALFDSFMLGVKDATTLAEDKVFMDKYCSRYGEEQERQTAKKCREFFEENAREVKANLGKSLNQVVGITAPVASRSTLRDRVAASRASRLGVGVRASAKSKPPSAGAAAAAATPRGNPMSEEDQLKAALVASKESYEEEGRKDDEMVKKLAAQIQVKAQIEKDNAIVEFIEGNEIPSIQKEEARKHIAAFQIAIEENFNNPKPITPYRGIGVNADVVEFDNGAKGLEITKIFPPKDGRFTGIDTTELQNAFITAVFVGGKRIEVSDLLDKDDGMKKIAEIFHHDGEVKFEINKNGKISQVTCDNSINKSAIYSAQDSSSLSELQTKNKPRFDDACHKAIKRGMSYGQYLYDENGITESFKLQMKKNGLQMSSDDRYVGKIQGVTTIVSTQSYGINIIKVKDGIATYMEHINSSLFNKDEIELPYRIIFPGNVDKNHWGTGEFNVFEENGIKKATLILHDPLGKTRFFGDHETQAFADITGVTIDRKSSPYATKRQHDGSSCGPIIAREMVLRLLDQDLQQVYQPFAPELRVEDMKNGVLPWDIVEKFSSHASSVSPSRSPTLDRAGPGKPLKESNGKEKE